VSKISTFKLTNLDLPYRDYKEWKWRQSIGNSIDYGPRFLEESPNTIFQARIYDHIHRFDSNRSVNSSSKSSSKNKTKKRFRNPKIKNKNKKRC
jgi:hypothetical protein